jgi:hypothetical protein
MAQLVADFPRCSARRITFDVLADFELAREYGWMRIYEAFCRCAHCHKLTTIVLAQRDCGHERQNVYALVHDLNKEVTPPLEAKQIDLVFEKWWKDLDRDSNAVQ